MSMLFRAVSARRSVLRLLTKQRRGIRGSPRVAAIGGVESVFAYSSFYRKRPFNVG